MPLYLYRCSLGHPTEHRRPIAGRDHPTTCPTCLLPSHRTLTPPQTLIRPPGWSLRPGDKGYWDFETAAGRLAPHERRQIAPFAHAESQYKSPPTPADDAVPVCL